KTGDSYVVETWTGSVNPLYNPNRCPVDAPHPGDSPIKRYDDNYLLGKPIPLSGDNYPCEPRFRTIK
ncbi:MAG: hypothetical protein KAR40_17660, partial [Candidatus Sabulitectum sp.]|nr:hypothetical protein [Candidatus Sabulitectum sp.]